MEVYQFTIPKSGSNDLWNVEVVNICYQTAFYSKMATVRKPFKQTQAIFLSAIHLPIKWADFL